VSVPTEAKVHSHPGEHEAADEHEAESARPDIHLGFIEEWYLVNPAAILGVLIALWRPRTKFPHAGHILISTWASSFHILMNTHRELSVLLLLGVFVVLFIAVWLPCCFSDIIFPMSSFARPTSMRTRAPCGGFLMTAKPEDKARAILKKARLYCTEARISILKC